MIKITRAGIQGSSQIGTCCRRLQRNSHLEVCKAPSASLKMTNLITLMYLYRTPFWCQIFASMYYLYNEVNSSRCSCCGCVYTHTYHSGVPQVQSVPAEALREAVRLLAYAVFVGFNAAMRCHRLPWKKKKPHSWNTNTAGICLYFFTVWSRSERTADIIPSLGTGCVSQNW